jgi:hypothetical protein
MAEHQRMYALGLLKPQAVETPDIAVPAARRADEAVE